MLSAAAGVSAGLSVQNLRCEYGANPVGIDAPTPRLSWQLHSQDRGARQTAYRVLVAHSLEALQLGQGDLWDTGKVLSDQSIQLHYGGKPPAARQQCFWKVRAWDKDGHASDWSPVATWEMGLPTAADWADASWIRLKKDTRHSPFTKRIVQTENKEKGLSPPREVEAHASPLFRCEFALKPAVVRARAYVCGLGYNEIYVNGRRAGGAVLDPGQTSYDVRAFYVTHDITKLLRRGTNAVGVMLGNGFFGQDHAFNTSALGYGQPALIAKIIVDYSDGTTQMIATDDSWKAETGPILYDNVYGGETYDARLERAGWTHPGYDDSAWQSAVRITSPTKKLQAQMIPPIRAVRTFRPRRWFQGRDGNWIFDLGQEHRRLGAHQVKRPLRTVHHIETSPHSHAGWTVSSTTGRRVGSPRASSKQKFMSAKAAGWNRGRRVSRIMASATSKWRVCRPNHARIFWKACWCIRTRRAPGPLPARTQR